MTLRADGRLVAVSPARRCGGEPASWLHMPSSPARYYPFALDGHRYEVRAGLYPLGTDFGNGAADRVVFQRDRERAAYRRAKERAVARAAEGSSALAVVVGADARADVLAHVSEYMRARLVRDCAETGCRASWALDRLAMDLQEDVAIVEREPKGGTRLAWMHVALPSGWSPWSKRGARFAAVHKPVPGVERIDGDALMCDIIEHGRERVRFVWGLQFDDGLDQHPRRGRRNEFDPDVGLWLRVERQVAVGLPAVAAMLFTIHPYVVPLDELAAVPGRVRGLRAAVGAMSDRELGYKGLRRGRAAILEHLTRLADDATD